MVMCKECQELSQKLYIATLKDAIKYCIIVAFNEGRYYSLFEFIEVNGDDTVYLMNELISEAYHDLMTKGMDYYTELRYD